MSGIEPDLLSGDRLKQAAAKCAAFVQSKIEREQKGFSSLFDKWFTKVLTRMVQLSPHQPWEHSVQEEIARNPKEAKALAWDFARFRLFLDRWEQGRMVDYMRRIDAGKQYTPRFGMEFGSDVFLTAQGAPALMHWRGLPLMKTVFDYALYPMLLAELKPLTIFEIGSGLGASALWLADHLKILGIGGHVHSVDVMPPALEHPGVTFYRGDCGSPDTVLPFHLLSSEPHPWLLIEDAHHNVENVLNHFHHFLRPGDYLVVEDSEVKRDVLRNFIAAHAGCYRVDTKYTDYFGRNATCAGDSIFARVGE